MKLLYLYDTMPKAYQAYMATLLEVLKKEVSVKVLTYNDGNNTDHNVISYGFKDRLQRFVSKVKLSKDTSLDIRIMKGYDIVHLQHSYLYSKLQPFFNNEVNKPKLVITLRGGDTYIKPWISDKWKLFYKENSTYIDAFITVSQHQKQYLQKWGVSENKIHVIPISFGSTSKATPKYPSDKMIKIVSAHRMCWEKNIEGNLRVIKTLKEQGYAVQYDVYGDGPDKGQLLYLIDKYNLTAEVNYFGKVENKVFKSKLPNYDFFLQLSHSEAFGASVIETQSMGIPAIISNTDGLPETIHKSKSGFCVDSFDINSATNHILALYNNPKMYYSFSNEAIAYSNANFKTTNEVKKLIYLYKNLVK